MAGALVQQATPLTVNGGTSRTNSLSGVAVGATLYVAVGHWNNGAAPGTVTGGGCTWTCRLNIGGGTGTNGSEEWEGLNSSGGSVTITWTRNGGNNVDASVCLAEFSGMPTSASYDVAASTTGTGTAPDGGLTATTAQADSLALSICSNNDGNITMVSRSGDGYTDLNAVTNGNSFAVIRPAYKVLSATGQQQGRFTLGGSTGWQAGVAVYKAAGGSAPATSDTGVEQSVGRLSNSATKAATNTVREEAKASLRATPSFKASSTTVTFRASARFAPVIAAKASAGAGLARGVAYALQNGAKAASGGVGLWGSTRLANSGATARVGAANAKGSADVSTATATQRSSTGRLQGSMRDNVSTAAATASSDVGRVEGKGRLVVAAAKAASSTAGVQGSARITVLSFKSSTAVAEVHGEAQYGAAGKKSSVGSGASQGTADARTAGSTSRSATTFLRGSGRYLGSSVPTYLSGAQGNAVARLSASGTRGGLTVVDIRATGRLAATARKDTSQVVTIQGRGRLASTSLRASSSAGRLVGKSSLGSTAQRASFGTGRLTGRARGSIIIGFFDPRGTVEGGVGGTDLTGGVGAVAELVGGAGAVAELVGGIG